MFDLHTHSLLSDGELIPSELVRRAVVHGYEAVAITDHVDFTNVEHILKCLQKSELQARPNSEIDVIRGVEITHVPPEKIGKLVKKALELGAELVVVHGETIAEPVERGTNSAAVSNPVVRTIRIDLSLSGRGVENGTSVLGFAAPVADRRRALRTVSPFRRGILGGEHSARHT